MPLESDEIQVAHLIQEDLSLNGIWINCNSCDLQMAWLPGLASSV